VNARFYFNRNPQVSLPWCVHRDDTKTILYTQRVRVLCHSYSHQNTEPTCPSDWVLLVPDATLVSESETEIVITSAKR